MYIGLDLSLPGVAMRQRAFSPLSLFSGSEPGAWFDPSDLTTLFQDAAGTTPVTAVEQPVGLMRDKSGRGNHASQSTATSRPVLKQDSGGLYYLAFDGTDDSLSTAAIDFSATDKMSVFAGVTKLSDAATGALVELSAVADTNDGSFLLFAPGGSGATKYTVGLRGTAFTLFDLNNYVAPITNLVSCGFDIAGASRATELFPRVNGAIPASITGIGAANAGTGNFGNYPVFIGARGGSSLRFNGRLYSVIIRGAATDAATIVAAERWVGSKTGVVL